MNRAVVKEIWDSKIAVRLHYGSKIEYFMIPRPAYLLVFFQNFIETALAAKSDENASLPWFYDLTLRRTLRWHVPASVLYDVALSRKEGLGVWDIELKFSGAKEFPEDILSFGSGSWKEVTESQVFMYAKMADQVRNRGEAISKLTPQQKDIRWTGAVKLDYDQFEAENRQMLDQTTDFVPVMLHQSTENTSRLIRLPRSSNLTTILQYFPEPEREDVSRSFLINGVSVSDSDTLDFFAETCTMADNCLHVVLFPTA